jgi:kynurenine formamidase
MGRKDYATYGTSWTPPDYEVDERGKLVGGYTPPGRNNWGRWGEEDERGTANLIQPAMIAAAAKLVERGDVFSLALPVDETTPSFPGRPTGKHYFLMSGTDAVAGSPYNEHAPGFIYNDDAIDIVLQGSTQWDGLAHAIAEDSVYNGFWAGNVTAMRGAAKVAIGAMRESFIGRGVLLDLARVAGVDSLEPGHVVTPEELDAACAAHGVEVGEGDILLLRTGYLSRWWGLETPEQKTAYFTDGEPGPGFACVDWLADRNIAAITCDTIGLEVLPGEPDQPRVLPVHHSLLVDLGLTIGELWDLDKLAADCAEDGRYEFLLVAPPLYLPRAVGSVLNPIAIK